jgi:hypothetical protein
MGVCNSKTAQAAPAAHSAALMMEGVYAERGSDRHAATDETTSIRDRRNDLQIGDVIELLDTHTLWATARLVATLNHADDGPLLLFHYEGWSDSWLMWVSPVHDASRMRPLSRCPGIGSRGMHTEASWEEIVRRTQARLRVESNWTVTGGGGRTHPFRSSGEMRLAAGGAGWRESQPGRRAGFQSCRALAAEPALCREMFAACTRATAVRTQRLAHRQAASVRGVAQGRPGVAEGRPVSQQEAEGSPAVVVGRRVVNLPQGQGASADGSCVVVQGTPMTCGCGNPEGVCALGARTGET